MLKTVYLWEEARLPEVIQIGEYAPINDTDPASSDITELAGMVYWMDAVGRVLIFLAALCMLLTVAAQLYIWLY